MNASAHIAAARVDIGFRSDKHFNHFRVEDFSLCNTINAYQIIDIDDDETGEWSLTLKQLFTLAGD